VLLSDGAQIFEIVPYEPDSRPDWDDPELEAALLAAVEGPHRDLSLDALRERGERVPHRPSEGSRPMSLSLS
jgi:hypothetical protein